MSLIIQDLTKAFGATAALDRVRLEVADGEFLALLGPSGSGKTTLLRVLAGLATPDAGVVTLGSEDLLAMTPRERRAGMVFQNYALFRHMTVAANIGFGLSVRPRRQRPSPAEIRRRTEELLALVQLEGYGGRYPAQLSGGQQQRVALARALAIEPRLLLLDEPFGALDARVRRDLRHWLRRIHDETGVTTVFVTHDQEEALDLADRVALLNEGRIVQVGSPDQIYASPASPFVFDFLGAANEARGEVRDGRLALLGASFAAPADAPQGAVRAFFRPHEIDLAEVGEGFAARIETVTTRGLATRVECQADGGPIEVEWPSADAPGLSRGAQIFLAPRRFAVFPA